jgi:hypothetical protein
MENDSNIFLGNGDYMHVQSSQNVIVKETLNVINGGVTPIQLEVTISADFNTIPTEYHEIMLNVMTARYLNKVSFGDNPFSKCTPKIKKRWYQFWKN